jgi:hypothetical protein
MGQPDMGKTWWYQELDADVRGEDIRTIERLLRIDLGRFRDPDEWVVGSKILENRPESLDATLLYVTRRHGRGLAFELITSGPVDRKLAVNKLRRKVSRLIDLIEKGPTPVRLPTPLKSWNGSSRTGEIVRLEYKPLALRRGDRQKSSTRRKPVFLPIAVHASPFWKEPPFGREPRTNTIESRSNGEIYVVEIGDVGPSRAEFVKQIGLITDVSRVQIEKFVVEPGQKSLVVAGEGAAAEVAERLRGAGATIGRPRRGQ